MPRRTGPSSISNRPRPTHTTPIGVGTIASGKPTKKAAKPRKSAAKPARSAAPTPTQQLTAAKEAAEDKVFALSHQVATLEGRESDLTELVIAHRERIARLETEREALQGERQALQGERQALRTQQQGLRRRSDNREKREHKLEEKLRAAREQAAALEAERDALRGEREEDGHSSTELRRRTDELQEKLGTARERAAALEAERNAFRGELERQTASASELRRLEQELQEKLGTARERAAALEAERTALRGELERETSSSSELRQRERDLQARLAGVGEQVARLETRRDALELALANEQQERSAELETRSREMRAQLREHREQAVRLEAERLALQEALDAQRHFTAELQERERELQEQAVTLESERNSLRLEARELQGGGKSAKQLEQELAELRQRTDDAERELAELDLQLAAAQARGDKLHSRLEGLQGSRTYKLMRATWRFRAAVRRPFRRSARPALAKGGASEQKAIPPVSEAPAPPAPATPAAEPEPAAPKPEVEQTPAPAAPAPAPQPSAARLAVDSERERWLSKAAAAPADVQQLRVAAILDEMSATCFAPDCDLLRVDSERWRDRLDAHQPHLLLVESTWQGNGGSWQYQVASYTHPDYIGLPKLKELVGECRRRGIPTVFWNKEDPVHFERFAEAAALFDHILTTDANCVERYAELEREGTGAIEAMQFAAQPRVHNPVSSPAQRSDSPVFAGAYYRDRHIDRQRSLEMLLDAARPMDLTIYDRRFGSEDKAFGFPERFLPHVRGSLTYEEMLGAYKSHKLFLNVNSVTDSPTMFSRRVFELLACETAVVSTESVGVSETLGDLVPIVTTSEEATEALTRLLSDETHRRGLVQRAMRAVISEHTYRHRLAQVARTVGLEVTAYSGEEVAAVALVDDVEQARQVRALVAAISVQTKLPAELLIGSHTSVAGDLQELPDTEGEIRVRVVQQDPEAGRIERFRELASLSVSSWVAILHPAHSYAEHHLADLMLATRYVEADVIGNACFEAGDEPGAVNPELEHRFVDSVHPHSALARRELVAARGWPDQMPEATGSLHEWFRDGVRLYSAGSGSFVADAEMASPKGASAAGSEPGPGA